MKMLVAGATGSIGLQVLNTAIEMSCQPVVLVRDKSKVKSLAREIDVFTVMFHCLKHLLNCRKILMPSSSLSALMARVPECIINLINLFSK